MRIAMTALCGDFATRQRGWYNLSQNPQPKESVSNFGSGPCMGRRFGPPKIVAWRPPPYWRGGRIRKKSGEDGSGKMGDERAEFPHSFFLVSMIVSVRFIDL